jgi:hypothetical protein
MLKHGEINPLNVMGIRQLAHCPPHFERVEFDIKVTEKQIADWVWENLDGRFWIGDTYCKKNTNTIMQKCVAFEQPAEASYFALFLDKINTWGNEFSI